MVLNLFLALLLNSFNSEELKTRKEVPNSRTISPACPFMLFYVFYSSQVYYFFPTQNLCRPESDFCYPVEEEERVSDRFLFYSINYYLLCCFIYVCMHSSNKDNLAQFLNPCDIVVCKRNVHKYMC